MPDNLTPSPVTSATDTTPAPTAAAVKTRELPPVQANGTPQPASITPADSATAKPADEKRFVFTEETVTMRLEYPIALGNGELIIDRVTLRKPHSGEMRGLAMLDIMRIDNDALVKLLPRITTPAIHKVMADALDPSDLGTLGKLVAGFFSSKKQRLEMMTELEQEYTESTN